MNHLTTLVFRSAENSQVMCVSSKIGSWCFNLPFNVPQQKNIWWSKVHVQIVLATRSSDINMLNTFFTLNNSS